MNVNATFKLKINPTDDKSSVRAPTVVNFTFLKIIRFFFI